MDKFESVVSEHAVTIGMLVKSVSKIEGFMEKSVEGQARQEVLLEKLANFESNTKSGFDRVHSRINKIELEIEKIHPQVDSHASICNAITYSLKTLGALVLTMLFGLLLWGIKTSGYIVG